MSHIIIIAMIIIHHLQQFVCGFLEVLLCFFLL